MGGLASAGAMRSHGKWRIESDTIDGGEFSARTIDVPLVEDTFGHCGVTQLRSAEGRKPACHVGRLCESAEGELGAERPGLRWEPQGLSQELDALGELHQRAGDILDVHEDEPRMTLPRECFVSHQLDSDRRGGGDELSDPVAKGGGEGRVDVAKEPERDVEIG